MSPTAACTDSAGVPRALGETWNSSLSGCCQHHCQAQDTIVPVDLDCPGPRPESCPRFGEVVLLIPTEDPCCLGAVCGESHHPFPSALTVKQLKGSALTLMDNTRPANMKVSCGGCIEGSEKPFVGDRSCTLGWAGLKGLDSGARQPGGLFLHHLPAL